MKYLNFLIFFVLIYNNSYSQAFQKNQKLEIVYLSKYGAVSNDQNDDYPAFKLFFENLRKHPRPVKLILPVGNLIVSKRLVIDFLEYNLSISSSGGTSISIYSDGFAHIQPKSGFLSLKSKANRNDRFIIVNDNNKIEKGDIVHIQSDTKFETGWGYKENDIQVCENVNRGVIKLRDSLIFNFNPNSERVQVKYFKKCSIELSNIEFIIKNELKNIRTTAVVFAGAKLDISNVRITFPSSEKEYFHNGIAISACVDSEFQDIYLDNLQYGVLINFTRNLIGKNTEAHFVRHAYVPSTASINISVDSLKGYFCHSVMDSHVSFNVHYKNVLDSLPSKYPDCRALGTFIENARIIPSKNTEYSLYSYWSVQTLVEEYKFLYGEFETRFKNVQFVSNKPGRLNGLNSFSIRKLIVENCITHNVSYYGDQKVIQSIEVKGSEVGLLYLDAHKATILKTNFSGDLFKDAPFVMRFSGSGNVKLDSIQVRNYNPNKTYLFDNFHNYSQANSIKIINSQFEDLKGWTNVMRDKGRKYKPIIINSSFTSFKDSLPVELDGVIESVKRKSKN